MSLADRVQEHALELGFSAVGIVPVGPARDAHHLDRWLDDGFAGEMAYMHNHGAIRRDTALLEPGMRSVVALAAPYGTPHTQTPISSYATRDDYHDRVRDRMRALGRFIASEARREVAIRPAVDSAPVLERSVALEAGIGWLGKSAMVLRQGQGSYFFLSELLVDVELDPVSTPQPDRCGRCTRCIDQCPTGAIVAPYRVDARRCISYLTIELRGAIPRALRPLIGMHLFGCDICQSVCPWNARPRAELLPGLEARPELVAMQASRALSLDDATFAQVFRGSPVKRARREGLARNACVVLGNTGDTTHVGALAGALAADRSPLVRGHAAWALGRIGGSAARGALAAAEGDPDEFVRDEVRMAVDGEAS